MAFFISKKKLSFFCVCSVLIINFGTIVSFAFFFSDHVLVRETERRNNKKSCEKKEKTEHELEPNLVKNFLSIFLSSSHDIESSLFHMSSCLLLSSAHFFLSRIFHLVYPTKIFMYKAMQSMLMKTSAPSFSRKNFLPFYFCFFPFYIFCITTITPKKNIFSDTRKKFSQVSDISKENAVDLKGFRLVRVIEKYKIL